MLITRILVVCCLAVAQCLVAGEPNPSPCSVSVSPNPARAGQSLVMHAVCAHCIDPRTTTIEREGSTVIVTDLLGQSCVPLPGLERFDVEIGAFLPGDYTLVHLFGFSTALGPFTFDPVTTGFVVEAQAVPASGAAARVLGILAVLALGIGVLWRRRAVKSA